MAANRLLIVDDEPEFGRFLRRVAESCGYEAKVVDKAEAFRADYAAFGPSLIALDLSMPEIDGIELLRFLAEAGCRAPILIVSGFDRRVLQAAERLGEAHGLRMAGIVSKPTRAADLRALLARLAEAA